MRRSLTIATVTILLAAGCARGSARHAPTSTAPPLGSDDKFAQCMAQNGAPVQQTTEGLDGKSSGGISNSEAPDDARKSQKAMAKCRKYLPNGGQPNKLNVAQLEQLRAVAKCMRAAGVAYPDPDPNAVGGPGVMPLPKGIDLNDASIRAKLQSCEKKAGFPDVGPDQSSSGR
jgi:hypothetical protein